VNLLQWQAGVHPISYLAGLLQSLLAAASAEPYNGVTLPEFSKSQTSPAQSAQGCPQSAYTNKEGERNFHNYRPSSAPSPALKRFKSETQPQLPAPAAL
jgi:hypothetical protein